MGVGSHEEFLSARTNHLCLVTALRSAPWSPHRNPMGLGNQQADRSARTNHRWTENAWLQHFDPLGGRPIETIWAWVTSERIEALEMPGYSSLIRSQVTQAQTNHRCVVSALPNSDRAPHRNHMGVGPHKEFGSAETNHN
jgi:hypothetical protein